MQFNSKISYRASKRALTWTKAIVFLLVMYFLYDLIKTKIGHFEDFEVSFSLLFLPKNILLISLILLLTPINWAFEAWKWQKLASKIENTTFWQAYKGVLVGLTLSTTTPLMIGDYAGKILLLKSDKRLQSIGAILLGNAIQLYISLVFGTISYVFFIIWVKPSPIFAHSFLVTILTISIVFGVYLGNNLSNISVFLSKNVWNCDILCGKSNLSLNSSSQERGFDQATPQNITEGNILLKYLKKYLIILENYTVLELRNLLLIAASRYVIFTIQFVLMFRIFQINLPLNIILAGIGIVFLTKTLISALNALGDLGIRTLTSVYYFGFFGANIAAVSSATFMIWLVNVLLPVTVGSVFVWQLKLSTKKL